MKRLVAILCVLVGHALVFYVVDSLQLERKPVGATEPMIAVFVQPRVIASTEPEPPPSWPSVQILIAAPAMLEIPELERPITRAAGVGLMVPRLADERVDARPYVRQAGLHTGEGATVVLRVEVLESGVVGRVAVEVSGGSPLIDEAATDYARSTPWIAGEIDGRPVGMWIHCGVRLQA